MLVPEGLFISTFSGQVSWQRRPNLDGLATDGISDQQIQQPDDQSFSMYVFSVSKASFKYIGMTSSGIEFLINMTCKPGLDPNLANLSSSKIVNKNYEDNHCLVKVIPAHGQL